MMVTFPGGISPHRVKRGSPRAGDCPIEMKIPIKPAD
jgi:hypothetical protein